MAVEIFPEDFQKFLFNFTIGEYNSTEGGTRNFSNIFKNIITYYNIFPFRKKNIIAKIKR